MIEHIKRLIKILILKPKTVFLIDGLGAVLTAIILMAVVRPLNEFFGMPQETLTMLSVIALIFAIYSFTCFVFSDNHPQKLLTPIIGANLAYCILTLGFTIYFYNRLTILGVTYFLSEALMICGLIYIELKTLNASRQNNSR